MIQKQKNCTNKRNALFINWRISMERHHLCFIINKVNSSQFVGLWHAVNIMLKEFETMSQAQEAFSRALDRYNTWKYVWTVVSLNLNQEARFSLCTRFSHRFSLQTKKTHKSQNKTQPAQITDDSSAAYTPLNRPLFLFSFINQNKSSKVLLLLDLHMHSKAYLATEPTKTLSMKST